jgi:branched-chain amino acid aminotransferase
MAQPEKERPLRVDINGRLIAQENASVSVFDRGFLYGDGVFETLRVYNGKSFRPEAHWNRLRRSAALIRLDLPFDESEYRERLERVVEVNGLKEAVARITVSRGIGRRSFTLNYDQRPTSVFTARPFYSYPEEYYEKGVAAIFATTRRMNASALNPAAKSANYLNSVLAKAEADDAGAFDAIMLNDEGFLAEGSVTNLFLVRETQLLTPSLESGVLPGITRATVLELAPGIGLESRETELESDDVFTSDEMFLTNTTVEILPVVRIGTGMVGDGMPGRVTRKLHEAYRELVKRECYTT